MSEIKAGKNHPFLQLLGLCRISSHAESGEEKCEAAVKSGKAFLVILSKDASKNTNKKFHDKCSFYQVPILDAPFDKEQLGRAMGQSQRSCIAITEQGLAKKLQTIIETMGEI